MARTYRFDTLAIHAGQKPDPTNGAVMTPVYLTSTYAQRGPGDHQGFEYSRTRNPTRDALQDCLAALEGAKHGLCFASGCATADAVMHLFDAGDRIVCSDDVYGGTFRLFDKVFKRAGLAFDFLDLTKPEVLDAALRRPTRSARWWWSTTPS
jgi:cystathionine gamma-lyase